jgi:hypothetical protein
MKLYRLAPGLSILALVIAGCTAQVDEGSEEPVTVDVETKEVAPESACGWSNVGATQNFTSCSNQPGGKWCHHSVGTCTRVWVGVLDGFFSYYWDWAWVSDEWIPSGTEQK